MKRRTIILLSAAVVLGVAAATWFSLGDEDEEAALLLQARQAARFNALQPRAKAGDINAQYAIAILYHEGKGVTRSAQTAARWYGTAAKRGHSRAQYALGKMYSDGDGVKKDFFKAARYFTKAAESGDLAEAQFALGQLHIHGRGVPHDYDAVLEWHRKAARQGHATAQFLMGAIFEEGWTGKRDLVEAYKWYSLATSAATEVTAFDKHFDPVAARARIKAKMSRLQIDRAEDLIKGWRPVAARPNVGVAGDGTSPTERRRAEARARALVKEPIHLRLSTMEVPVGRGGQRFEAVTVVLDVAGETDVETVCIYSPRIRDAVLQILSKDPIPLSGNRLSLDRLPERLLAPINRALGVNIVSSVLVRAGEVADKRGAVVGLPFASVIGCPEKATPETATKTK